MSTQIPKCWHDAIAAPVADDTWRAYWERIEDRQHVFRVEAADYTSRVERLLKPGRHMRALDFGCGFGHTARRLAPLLGSIALWDASAAVRRQARRQVADLPNVEFLDLESEPQPADIGRFHLILVHSVLQYMSEEEIRGWLSRFRQLLEADGRLLLSDLIIPGAGGPGELLEYLRFARRHGFFWNALWAGVSELAHYWKARQSRPLTTVSRERLATWASAAGLDIEWLQENLSHRQARACAVLRPATVRQAPG